MRISDRTAAVKRSFMQKTIGRRAEKAAWGDESKSEDLPVNQTYFILRTKEWYVPGRRAAERHIFPARRWFRRP